jgi:hypothetical protein
MGNKVAAITVNGETFNIWEILDSNSIAFGMYPDNSADILCEMIFGKFDIHGAEVWAADSGLFNSKSDRKYFKFPLLENLFKWIVQTHHVKIVNSTGLSKRGEKFWRSVIKYFGSKIIDLSDMKTYDVSEVGKTISGKSIDDPGDDANNSFFFLIEGGDMLRFGTKIVSENSVKILPKWSEYAAFYPYDGCEDRVRIL